jgi:hypothetical protein
MARKEAQKWAVTRQHYWYWGVDEPESYVVEIAYGGLDYANPDALGATYPGEMNEFYDPREAVRTAYRIAIAWKRDHPELAEWIKIATGWTWGSTLPFEQGTIGAAWAYAQKYMEEIDTCAQCGDVVGKERYTLMEYDDDVFCSEDCAERTYDDMMADRDEDDGEGEYECAECGSTYHPSSECPNVSDPDPEVAAETETW